MDRCADKIAKVEGERESLKRENKDQGRKIVEMNK